MLTIETASNCEGCMSVMFVEALPCTAADGSNFKHSLLLIYYIHHTLSVNAVEI